MHFRRLSYFVALALLTSCAPGSYPAADLPPEPPIQTATGQGHQAANDIAHAYDRICLAAFPDERMLQDLLFRLNAAPLNPADLHAVLPSELGRAWRLPNSAYTVIVESSPYPSCAIRRMTRVGLPSAQPYLTIVDAYARHNNFLQGRPRSAPRQMPRGADGLTIAIPLTRPGTTQPAESSIYEVTNYHGHFDPARDPEAVGGAGVEIRLVHRLGPPG